MISSKTRWVFYSEHISWSIGSVSFLWKWSKWREQFFLRSRMSWQRCCWLEYYCFHSFYKKDVSFGYVCDFIGPFSCSTSLHTLNTCSKYCCVCQALRGSIRQWFFLSTWWMRLFFMPSRSFMAAVTLIVLSNECPHLKFKAKVFCFFFLICQRIIWKWLQKFSANIERPEFSRIPSQWQISKSS